MRRLAATLTVVMALSACGGAPDVGEAPAGSAATDPRDRAMALAASSADAPPVGASGTVAGEALPLGTARKAAPPAAYDIRLVDENGWRKDSFELVPVRGAGYQTLHAVVVLRGLRALSPVAGVQPYCATPVRCEYLPTRKDNDAERYTVTLNDDSVARLSTTNGMIAISARHLEVERPSIVSVTLTVDGQSPVTKRITYAKSPG